MRRFILNVIATTAISAAPDTRKEEHNNSNDDPRQDLSAKAAERNERNVDGGQRNEQQHQCGKNQWPGSIFHWITLFALSRPLRPVYSGCCAANDLGFDSLDSQIIDFGDP
jgi:hypothetical protein